MPSQNLTIAKLQNLCQEIVSGNRGLEVCVAGGAVRDILNGRPVKDIDVFISGGDGDTEDYLTTLTKVLHCEPTFSSSDEQFEIYGKFIANFPSGLHYVPVQAIYCVEQSVREIVESFDFGLCQVWCDAGARVHALPAYYHDVANQKITLVLEKPAIDDRKQLSRSKEHLKRIQAKYPTFRPQRCGPLSGV